MSYIICKLKKEKIYTKIIGAFILGVLIVKFSILYAKGNNFFILGYDDIVISFKVITNLAWQYFLPICCYYLYITNSVFFGIEDDYISKFKSKSSWINIKIFQLLIITSIYITVIFISIFFSLNVIYKEPISNIFSIEVCISWFLQVGVLLIYSLVCVLVGVIFQNKKNLSISITKVIICSMTFIGYFTDYLNLILNISLFNLFTLERISENFNQNITFALFFLIFIIYIIINIIYYIVNKLDILKFNEF